MTMAPAISSAPPVVPLKHWIAFLTMAFGMFMAILDIQIVSSSISEIQAGISASADEIVWVQSAYLIAEVIMIPFSGFLSRAFSTRLVFTFSCLGFTIASFFCACSENLSTLIFFRACQGFIGGAMIPTVFATSFTLFPLEYRARASIIVGLVATMAPTLGPTIGGYLTNTFSWHWLFLINIIPGFIISFLTWKLVDFDKSDYSVLKGFDFIGLILMALFLGSLEYVLEEGPRYQWLEDPSIQLFSTVMVLSAVGFFWRMFSYRFPIVDIGAFKDLNFAVGTCFSFILGIGLYGLVYLLPLYLYNVRGYDSLQIGNTMFVTGLFQFISAPLAGNLAPRVNLKWMLFVGFSLFAINAFMSSSVTADFGFDELFIPQMLRGVSLMCCFIPINIFALGTLPPDRIKNASALYNTARNLGGAIGLALINTLLIQRLAHHKTYLQENIVGGNTQVENFMAMVKPRFEAYIPGNANTASLKLVSNMVAQQAMILSIADVFYVMGWLFALTIIFIPFIKTPKAVSASLESH